MTDRKGCIRYTFSFSQKGMEAKISGAMPPTSSSGLVSNPVVSPRNRPSSCEKTDPKKYFQTRKPKSSSEILCPSQKSG